jgi:hypothetical protein
MKEIIFLFAIICTNQVFSQSKENHIASRHYKNGVIYNPEFGGGEGFLNKGWQENPFAGDVINSYNDGPVEDGSIMGPFYEIETSSPGAELEPGESLTHIQRVVHVQGDQTELSRLVEALFGLDLQSIASKFQPQ